MKCPYCKEDVADDAIKCKHCGSNIKTTHLSWKSVVGYIVITLIIGLGTVFFLTPNSRYFFDVKECKGLISEKMKDPGSMEFLDYSVENKVTYISISGKYKATNSYGAFMQGTFVCDTLGGKMTGLLFE